MGDSWSEGLCHLWDHPKQKSNTFFIFMMCLDFLDPHYIHLGSQIAEGAAQMKFEQEGSV